MPKSRVFTTIMLALSLTMASVPALSETKTKVKKTTVTTVESESDEASPEAGQTATDAKERESSITASFGSKSGTGTAGCKTEELSKSAIKDLKADCKAWVKDQRADLKSRFLTSSCDESCEDCGMSLKRCMVTGTVRFVLK